MNYHYRLRRAGIYDFCEDVYLGAPVTIKGSNGYTVKRPGDFSRRRQRRAASPPASADFRVCPEPITGVNAHIVAWAGSNTRPSAA